MAFGDPWTPAQRALADIVVTTWLRTGQWPTFQYVASMLEDGSHLDATEVLRSFPSLGERGTTQRAYADVNFDHIRPFPPEESRVSFSAAGLSRHPLGVQSVQAFVAVLKYIAERWAEAPRDPTKVVTVKVTSEEVEAALPRWPREFLQSAMSLIQIEPLDGITNSGINPENGHWDVTVDRRFSRYRDVTVESYLAQVEEEYGRTSRTISGWRGYIPPNQAEPALMRLSEKVVDNSEAKMPSMNLERAIQELRLLKQEADGPEVQAAGPVHDQWRAKVRTVMQRALGRDASVLRDFEEVNYRVGVWTGAPGEAEEDASYFAQQVKSAVAYIDAAIYELQLNIDPEESVKQSQPVASPESDSTSIFLVHGHGQGAKHEVARYLAKIVGREPIILDEQPNAGQTLVEKFEQHAGSSSYAVVLLTPDDVGRAAAAPPEGDAPRARQNVVFELGYFFGKLGRGKVTVINAGVEKPSDVDGLAYISYPESNWKTQLARELQTAGIVLNLQAILE